MISLWVVFSIIAIHYIADFCLQTEYQATNKSKSWEALLDHTFIYSCCWALPSLYWFAEINVYYPTIFFLVTFIVHTVTDYYTSRLNKKLAVKALQTNNWHNFFVSVGFDQVLHYIQLFLTYYLLTI